MKRAYLYTFTTLFTLILLSSCAKEESPFTIPYAKVNFEIDIRGIDSDLRPFTYKIFTRGRSVNEFVGYGGLLIFMSAEGKIFAYDLCCPYEDDKSILVEPQSNGKAICKTCESSFITMFGLGTPEGGPSKESLQKYQVLPSSQRPGVYFITN